MSFAGRITEDYRATWTAAGTGGQAILLGTFAYIFRVVGFSFLLPLYVKASGYSSEQYGFLFASMNVVPILGLIPVLVLARRGWDRRIMMLGPALGFVGIGLLILARDAPFAVWGVATVLCGTSGCTYWTLSDPLLAEATSAELRPRAYALKWLFFTCGSSLGALLGGLVPDGIEQFGGVTERNAYWGTLFVFLVLEAVQVWIFRRVPIRKIGAAHGTVHVPFRVIGASLVLLGTAEAMFGLGYSTIRPFMSLFLTEREGLSSGTAGLIIASTAVFAAIGGLLMPVLAGILGNTRALFVLRLAGALTVAGWFAVGELPAVIALTLLYYGVMDGTSALYAAEVMGRLPPSVRDVMAGVNSVMWAGVAAVAASLSGYLQDRPGGGFGLAFSVGIAGYVLSALWCLLVLPRVTLRHTGPD